MLTSPAPNQTGTATETISYCYDELHRVTGKAYSAQSCPLSSPAVTYSYDSGTNAKGHLTGVTDQAGSASYSYDVLGRLSSETRVIAGVSKTVSYEYNLDSSLKTLHYPSGRAVTYTPNSAGRPITAADSNGTNYVSSASYNAPGAERTVINGGTLTNSFFYNPRLQLCRITAWTSGSVANGCDDPAVHGNLMDRGYNFNFGSANNGNVISITNYRDTSRSQSFTYDALNRITSGWSAANTGTLSWGENYTIDAWGNLQMSPMAGKAQGGNFTNASDVTNRPFGLGYDAAGNLTNYTAPGQYVYDAENRIQTTGGMTYAYDADGNRVEKSGGSTGTLYWYGSPGIIAESDLTGTLKSEYVFFGGKRIARIDLPGNSVHYYLSDHLNSTSMIVSAAGVPEEESDYSPFGTEYPVTGTGANHYKFTGKERDSESGLDYFGARYYGSNMGRFMSTDWSANPEAVPYSHLDDPQTLNLYAYVRNNPMSLEDPDGHGIFDWLKEKGCNIGFSSLCAPPPPPTPDQKQNLVSAQDAARNDPSLQKDKNGTTHCNQATCQIAGKTGAPMGPLVDKNGHPLSANQQATNLANSKDYREVSPTEAEQIANNGGTVLVAYHNPNGHGHTATVRAEGVPGDNPPAGGRGPLINDIGNKNRVQNANFAFRKDADVHYYTPK